MIPLIHVTNWERASLWRRIPCAFVRVSILLALVSVLIMLLGPPITIFVTARSVAKRIPGVTVGPRPLSDYSVSDAPGTALSYFGYKFEAPWNTGFKEKGIVKGGFVQLESRTGQNL